MAGFGASHLPAQAKVLGRLGRVYRSRSRTGAFALFGLLLALACSPSWGQYLNREYYPLWQNETYENYAHFGYRDVRLLRQGQSLLLDEAQRAYDPFGATLLNGRDLYRAQEFRSLSPFGGSLLFKDALYRDLFQNLVVANDTYQGWGTSAVVGRAVEARFHPMQLSVLRMDGIRWDGDSRRNRFSVLGSRISEPLRVFALSRPLDFATFLFGGHWQTQLGSALRFGASYVNLHLSDTLRRRGEGSFRKGVFPTNLEPPQTLFLAVSDDSPEDGGGARVHAVELYVNGQRSQVTPQIRKIRGIIGKGREQRAISQRLRLEDLPHLRQRQAWLPRAMDFGSLFDPSRGLFSQGEVLDGQGGLMEASGDDVLLFSFAVPPEARELSFRLLVAGDYAIDMGAPIGWSGVLGRSWEDWRNAARARGNPREGANLEWVEFDYGFPTGLELYGAQAELRLLDFQIRGDYHVSAHHLLFPVVDGPRRADRQAAYSLRGQRPWGRFDLGFELFRVPPRYRTAFTYWDDAVPRLKDYQLVEDNDDGDPWPDAWEHDDPLSLRFQPDITLSPQETRENLEPPPLRDVGFGVFPGLDDNGDGIFDTNVNDNLLPDHLEPFLMYYVESEDFVYGDDFDNNGVVDSRENDNAPDYPYELDSEGRHLFATFKPGEGLQLTLGTHRVEQLAGGGRNRALYSELEYRRPLPGHLQLELRHRLKRVQDDIPDPLYQYVSNPLLRGNYEIALQNDPLNFRNSLADLSFVQLRYTGVENLNLGSALRWEHNHRLAMAAGLRQPQGDDWSIALVNRADYTWQLTGKWVVTPMLKATYRRAYSSQYRATLADETVLAPIVRADYRLTERTVLRAGVQGFPFLKHRLRNGAAAFRDFDAWHYLIAFQTQSSYIGYQVSMNMGLRKSFTEFTGSASLGRAETSEFFLQVRTN